MASNVTALVLPLSKNTTEGNVSIATTASKKPKRKPKDSGPGKPDSQKNKSKPNPRAKHLTKDYRKRFAIFQCEHDRDHTWKSMHAWKGVQNEVYCDVCEQRGSVVDAKEEICSLVVFVCRCGDRWTSMKDESLGAQVETCDLCHEHVRGGVQERNATHFWYKCSNTSCATEWEDAYIVEQFSQRCRQCFGRGKLIGTRIETTVEQATRMMKRNSVMSSPNTGPHDIQGCDMCQKFISQGQQSCRSFKKVVMDYEIDGDGNISTKIAWMSKS